MHQRDVFDPSITNLNILQDIIIAIAQFLEVDNIRNQE